MSNNTQILNISTDPKINELCRVVMSKTLPIQRSFQSFAERIKQRISQATNSEKTNGALIFNNKEFSEIINDQTEKKTQTRDFRTTLKSFGIIAHAVSDVKYRDLRREKRVMSKSNFQVLIQNQTIAEFIRIFCAK